MAKENLCVQFRCSASCCRNVSMGMDFEEFRVFAQGTDPWQETEKCLNVLIALTEVFTPEASEVHYSERDVAGVKKVRVLLIGACPKLDNQKSQCTIYENRPAACERLEVGGTNCNSARKMDNLPKINFPTKIKTV